MRSQYASDETPTYVELTFWQERSRYRPEETHISGKAEERTKTAFMP